MMLLKAICKPPLVVLILVLPALAPLMRGLPAGDDAFIHLYRIVELDWHIQHGIFYPRVAADLVYGYSYPLFNFYPPLIYYLGESLHLPGLDFVPSLLILLGLTIYLPALGAYQLLADMFDETAGYAAAVGLTYAPYTFYNLLHRTAAPEAWALGLAPWLLWAFRRLALNPTRRHFLLATLLYAALLLSHNLSALLLTPFVWAWAVVFSVVGHHAKRSVTPALALARKRGASVSRQSSGGRWRSLCATRNSPLVSVHSSFIIAFSLSAFFWLPALAETRWVHIQRAYQSPGLIYSENFLPLSEILARPHTFDPSVILPFISKSLGWPQLNVAAAAPILLLATRRRSTHSLEQPITRSLAFPPVLFIAGLLLATFMATSASHRIWQLLPFLSLTQFPWRFLGQATLFAGLLTGAAVGLATETQIISRRRALLLPIGILGVTALYSFPWTFAKRAAPINQPTVLDVQAYEAEYALGTNTAAEYLPIWVHALPDPEPLAAQYAVSPVIDRLDRAALPATVTVLDSGSELLAAHAQFDSSQDFAAVFNWFYFPGWRATLDGARAPITITEPHGLISVRVPAGNHTVSVGFGESPIRAAADITSLVALIVLAGIALGRKPLMAHGI